MPVTKSAAEKHFEILLQRGIDSAVFADKFHPTKTIIDMINTPPRMVIKDGSPRHLREFANKLAEIITS